MSAFKAQPDQIMEVIWSLQEESDELVPQSMEGHRWFVHTADGRHAGAVR